MADLIVPSELFLTFLTGLILGSFATALVWRIPRGESWIRRDKSAARSACPACGHGLGWRDLVPLFSWLALRGRCRYCSTPIARRYPAIELATALLCLLVWCVLGWTPPGWVVMATVPFLVALVVIDLDHMILPDQINIILAVFGLLFIGTTPHGLSFTQGAEGALAYAVLAFSLSWGMTKILKRDAMGQGDVKFFTVAGLWLGIGMLPAFLALSGLGGIVFGLLWKKITKQDPFPFGPALVFAFTACLLARAILSF